MAFAVPSLITGAIIATGVTISPLQLGAYSNSGLYIPRLELGALSSSGMRIPSLVTGAVTLGNDLRIPSLLVGAYSNEPFNYPVATSLLIAGSSASAEWNAAADALAALAVSGNIALLTVSYPNITSTAALTSTGASPTIFWEVVASAASVADAATAQRLLDVTVSASVVLNGAVIGSASYHVSAASIAEIVTGIQFVQDFWDGWAFNLNNNAPSFYENFKFNSFARIGKNYYGCNDSGIHLLGADLDGAEAINSTITLGKSDLSTDKFYGGTRKSVPAVYVAARSVEPLKLTCRVEGQEYTYTFSAAADEVKQTRVEPGKGLLGTFWQFELTNQNGADYEILSLTAKPHALKRRL